MIPFLRKAVYPHVHEAKNSECSQKYYAFFKVLHKRHIIMISFSPNVVSQQLGPALSKQFLGELGQSQLILAGSGSDAGWAYR